MNNSDKGIKKSFFDKVFNFLASWILSKGKKRKEQLRNEPVVKALKNQIFNLFAPQERYTAPQIVECLKERTGGRRDVALFLIYECLDWLVEEKKLLSEVVPVVISGTTCNKKVYFLFG